MMYARTKLIAKESGLLLQAPFYTTELKLDLKVLNDWKRIICIQSDFAYAQSATEIDERKDVIEFEPRSHTAMVIF